MKGNADTVVITGMGLVSPLGRDLGQVWERMVLGHSGISRWNGTWGGLMKGLPIALVCEFQEDPRRGIDFACEAALDALKDAGLFPLDSAQADRTRFGIAVGNSKGGIAALEKALRTRVIGPEMWNDFFHHAANSQIMRTTGICGPCLSSVSACATGAHNIVQGVCWILDNQADYVLAGAAESSLTELILSGFQKMGVLAQADAGEDPKTACRPYDGARKGFVVGEGAGVVVLERLSSAHRRNAKVYAEIAGWGFAGDGYKPVSFDPAGDSIERAAAACLRRAGINAAQMDYIHCHGTGTRENDIIETRALKRLLGCGAQRTALSSTKPMTGHLLGAAGSVELICTVLAMRNNFIPATLNLDNPDTECDLDYTAKIGRSREIQNAMTLSYGFGGHVAALVVRRI